MNLALKEKITSWRVTVLISFLWGLAEGTFFYIIPDVVISLVALCSFKKGILSSFWTLLGSIVGAGMMYFSADNIDANHFLLNVPLISQLQINTAVFQLREHGAFAVVFGLINGIPHKIYSLHASSLGIKIFPYLLYSSVSRFFRFFLVTIIFSVIAKIFKNKPFFKSTKLFWGFYFGVWIAIYTIYFFTAL